MHLPTVRIKHAAHPAGVTINESDFDPDRHELHGATEAGTDASSGEPSGDGKAMTVAEMRALLVERGVDIPEGTKKAWLRELIEASNPAPAEAG